MSRIKRITSDQFLVLAALEMPVYSCHADTLDDRGKKTLLGLFKDEQVQSKERRLAEHYSKEYSVFYTLVEEE